jgi:hypothetical protein
VFVRCVWWCLSLAIVSGCAPSAPVEELVPVSGTVRFGGQPTAGIRVLLVPDGATGGTGGFGVTDDEGKYTLLHRTQKEGVPPGKYSVHFSRFLMPDGKPIPSDVSPFTSGGKESIPPKWSDPTQKGPHNSVVVPEDGKTDLDFAIPKK